MMMLERSELEARNHDCDLLVIMFLFMLTRWRTGCGMNLLTTCDELDVHVVD